LRELERRSAETHEPRPQQELLLEMPEDAPEPEALRALRELDPDAMTPKAALDALYALKRTL
jgi:DNA mismatch repair protein MutS